MQPSILQAREELPVPVPIKKQKEQGTYAPQAAYYPQEEAAAYPQPYAEYPKTEMQYAYAAPSGIDAEAIEEIAEEIASEKIKEFKSQVGDIAEFKQDTEANMATMNERIKRIETSMDKLQAALLGKVSEYGKDIKDLGSEMRALEGAFSKILNPLVENVKDLSEITDRLKAMRAGTKIERAEKEMGKIKEEIEKIKPEGIEAKPIIRIERAVKHVKHRKKHKIHKVKQKPKKVLQKKHAGKEEKKEYKIEHKEHKLHVEKKHKPFAHEKRI